MPWSLTTTGLTQVRQQYALAAQMTGPMIAQVFTRRLTEATAYARSTFRSAAQTTPTATAVRTGALRAALGSRVEVTGTSVRGTFGYLNAAVSQYASVHEGWPDNRASTTIRPTQSKFLTIPLPGALTAAGVPRGRARDFPNTFFARPNGRLILFQRQGTNIVPLFLLVSQVVVPSRPALLPTMARFLPLIVQDLTQGATQLVRG